MNDNAAIFALRERQQQLDPDGIMVGVSRQALEETLCYVTGLEAEVARQSEVIASALEHLEKGATLYVMSELRKEVDGD